MAAAINNVRLHMHIRRSLLQLVADSNQKPLTNESAHHLWRRSLRGSNSHRSNTVEKANRYLACMKIEAPEPRAIPSSLNLTLGKLRKTANNVKLDCYVRIGALEKQLRLAGFSCGVHHHDDIDKFIDRCMGWDTPTPAPQLPYEQARDMNWRGALEQIRKNFLLDLAEGRFRDKTLQQLVECLRLDSMEPCAMPAKPSPAEVHREELNSVLDSL